MDKNQVNSDVDTMAKMAAKTQPQVMLLTLKLLLTKTLCSKVWHCLEKKDTLITVAKRNSGNRNYCKWTIQTLKLIQKAYFIVEQRKAYGPIKLALKERGIRYQTPYTKMRVPWDSGLRIYGSAEEAAQDCRGTSEWAVTVETHQHFGQSSSTHKREAYRV